MDGIYKENSLQDRRCRKRAIKRTCPVCGIDFYATKDITGKFGGKNLRKQKYCSKKCWNIRGKKINYCKYCNKKIITYKSVDKKYCNFECRNKGMIGKKLSEKTKIKMSKVKKGIVPKNAWKSGKLHPFWKKDRSLIKAIETKEYNELRLKVFKRDNYTCQICKRRGKKGMRIILELHHIKSKKDYPELFWKINNCQTVCNDCHKKTDSYLNRWG